MGARDDPAREAWELLWELMQSNKPRFIALAQELGLSPMQMHTLRNLEPGVEMPMSSLADKLFCDNSNITGMADRLEARGLIERRPADYDRRVKLLVLTEEGERLRAVLTRQLAQPPAEIADLPLEHKRALRDALRAALRSPAETSA
jgi:MarR family transcriptional regulator, organic hydroperoxide resistance regulator